MQKKATKYTYNIHHSKYVDLKKQGKLFPSWIVENFKDYILDEIKMDGDMCTTSTKAPAIHKYQEFLANILDYNSPHKSILVYHGLGSGKTVTALNIYNSLFTETPDWDVFILIKSSLLNNPWLSDIHRWMKPTISNFDKYFSNIRFIRYDSPIAHKEFIEEINKSVNSRRLYIIDEVHNFINNVYNNILSESSMKAKKIYDYIKKDVSEHGNKLICMSFTPVVNVPFELALLFNLMRDNIFPNNEGEFNDIYIKSGKIKIINSKHKNSFQRRILGLVSYYAGSIPGLYAEKIEHIVNVKMSDHQKNIYDYFDYLSDKENNRQKYLPLLQQICNFTFPEISDTINHKKRPRPTNNTIDVFVNSGDNENISTDDKKQVNRFLHEVEIFMVALKKLVNEKIDYDNKSSHDLQYDYNSFKTTFNKHFYNYCNSNNKKSETYNLLYKSSPKMMNMLFNIHESNGIIIVFSKFVVMEGLDIFKIYLHAIGYNLYSSKNINDHKTDYMRYVEYTGLQSYDVKKELLEITNSPDNYQGKHIKIVLLSISGSEGINFRNIKQLHIMEPHWNDTRNQQVIGRAIRHCSHSDLEPKNRFVDIYKYKTIHQKKQSADYKIDDIAQSKNILVTSFLDAMKEVAIDCILFKKHNMISEKYNCFQFDEHSLFNKHMGELYKQYIGDDVLIDSGNNSKNTHIISVKVYKVKAVKLLRNNQYSEPHEYWYRSETNIVYDIDLHNPIGKVGIDSHNNVLLHNNMYVITKLIPIPLLNNA
jgi:superfamily II DNA or RNA helicase